MGLTPERMILFGSYAKGRPHPYSDVDIAIWHTAFTGDRMLDLELLRPLYRKFKGLDIKTFPSDASDLSDAFIASILEQGIDCLEESSGRTKAQVV
jgi:predicted nucleotidyltransferase